GFDQRVKSVLLLGLGGGSVIETLREEFGFDAFIEAVEIDSGMISVAVNEFDIKRFSNVSLVHADASDYLDTCKARFDLIIVDIFIGDTIPETATGLNFIHRMVDLLNPKAKIIYNTMRATMKRETLDQITDGFAKRGLRVRQMKNVESTNDLIIAESEGE
ncbi:MAG TPA: methyltransferase domain-containing protein, partial [Cyclobacteriaceae bacterium]